MTTMTTRTNITTMTIATMMTIANIRKLEVVHKEVGGCLISYTTHTSCACISAPIALNWNTINDSVPFVGIELFLQQKRTYEHFILISGLR